MRIFSCKHTHLFEMMWHLYFSWYKLFNYKYVHIIKPNVLHWNKDFFSFLKPNLVYPENFSTTKRLKDIKYERIFDKYNYNCLKQKNSKMVSSCMSSVIIKVLIDHQNEQESCIFLWAMITYTRNNCHTYCGFEVVRPEIKAPCCYVPWN